MTTNPSLVSADGELRSRLQAREMEAVAEVYDDFGPAVYGLALRVTRHPDVARRVTREVFGHIWQHPDDFEPERAPMRVWINTLTHRSAVRWLRARSVVAADGERDESEPPGTGNGATGSALDALPDAQRQAIDMAYLDGLTYREVAESVGIPDVTAKARITLGMGRLADRLSPQVFERRQ